MTLADLIKDFIDTGKERLKTPISGAFLWAFVIWNWRPIVLLLFSEQTIEDRIQIIDQYFCTLSALLWPISLALFYTIAVPAIMTVIDWVLTPIKKIRIGRIYQSKDFVTDEKIKLARKEFELKSVETGNKQIEDFERQIQELEKSKNDLVDFHKLEKNEFENIIKHTTLIHKSSEERNTELQNQIAHLQKDLKERNKESQIDDRVMVALTKLTPDEAYILRLMTESKNGIDNFNREETESMINNIPKFIDLGLIEEDQLSYTLTRFGYEVVERIGNIAL